MPDNPPRDRRSASDRPREFGLSVVSPRYCVACNACQARFRRVGATCEACGADYAIVGVSIRPLGATDTLFEPRSARLERRAARRFGLAFWRLARSRH